MLFYFSNILIASKSANVPKIVFFLLTYPPHEIKKFII